MLGPNITGRVQPDANSSVFLNSGTYTGPFAITNPTKDILIHSSLNQRGGKVLTFEAKRSDNIYGASKTVQPNSVTSLILIKI